MKTLHRYLGRNLLFGTLASLLALLTLFSVLGLVEQLGDVGQGRYTTEDAILYVVLGIPRNTYELFPIAVLLGSLGSLGSLAGHSELIAMRAAGISLARIVLSVMRAGFLMMLFIIALGELVAPPSEQYAQQMRSERLSQQMSLRSKYGFWARDGHAFINIRKIISQGLLEDLYIYEFGAGNRLSIATHADQARYQGDKWLLKGIRQTLFHDSGTSVRQLEQATWSSLLDPELLKVVSVQTNVLPVWGLWRYIEFLRQNGQDSNQYEVAFWGKMALPLITLAMLFLSIPFLFGNLRNSSVGQRIFIGTLIGLTFFLGNKAIFYLAVVYQLNPLLAAFSPALLVTGFAIWSIRRVI